MDVDAAADGHLGSTTGNDGRAEGPETKTAGRGHQEEGGGG